jgi:hypothetical protein
MTDHEMRVRLAEAMGWTEIRGEGYWMGPDGAYASTIPNPWKSDRDAARLRAWCVAVRNWNVTVCHHDTGCRVVIWPKRVRLLYPSNALAIVIMPATEEFDTCRRERRAFCEAVLQAINAEVRDAE